MAKKKNVEKSPRRYTKRQLSSIQRQKRRKNIILYGGIGIIVVVIILVLVGVLDEIRPYRQTALKVYDREYNVQYYMDAARYSLDAAGSSFSQLPLETQAQYFDWIVQGVPNSIQGAELTRRAAEELEITVSDDEVKALLEENGLTVTDASIDLVRAELLRERLLDEYFGPDIPENADQVNIKAMFLESEIKVNEIKDMLDAGDNFTELAANYSVQYYTKNTASDLGWHIEEWMDYRLGSTVPFDYAFSAEPGTLSEAIYDADMEKQLGYWLVNVLERDTAEHAHVQVILVDSEHEAEMIEQRILNGEDFGDLARQFSLDEGSREQGGDLGVTVNGSRTEAFNTNVFAPDAVDVGIIGPFIDEGISTAGGYWLIDVVDKEAGPPVSDEDQDFLESRIYDEWITQLYEEATDHVDSSYLTTDTLNWIKEKLREELF